MTERDDELPELAPWVRAALLGGDEPAGPSGASRARMAARLAAATGVSAAALLDGPGGGGGAGGAGGGGGAGATSGGGATAATSALSAKAAAVGGGLLVAGSLAGYGVATLLQEPPPAPVVSSLRPDAGTADAALAPDPVDGGSSDRPVDAPDPPDAGPQRAPIDASPRGASPPDAAPAAASSLARERELIDVARSALRQGEVVLAARSLAEHGLRFPDGALVEEREVLWIEAELARGDRAGATRRAQAFRARYPASVFTSRVNALVP